MVMIMKVRPFSAIIHRPDIDCHSSQHSAGTSKMVASLTPSFPNFKKSTPSETFQTL